MNSTNGTIFGREPALIYGAIAAIIALAVGFGLRITAEQTGLILAVVTAIMAVVIRQSVYSPQSAGKIANTQYRAGLNEASQPDVPAPPATGGVASNTDLGERVRRV